MSLNPARSWSVPLLVAVCLSLCLSAWRTPALADAAPARAAIVAVIQAQLAAFQRNDATAAFHYASPGIRAHFGTPSHFMRMVRMSYAPLYRHQGVRFLDLQQAEGQLVQRVLVTGADLGTYMAHYPMLQLDDGQWRIAGCVLVPLGQGRGA